jgi:hypothetical protein
MAANFQSCPSCARHIKVEEAACPFCGGALPETFGASSRKGAAPLSRAAILFMGATAVTGASAACSSSSNGSGHTNGADSGEVDTGSVVAAYGPAIIDSGKLDSTAEPDVVALYGPAPVLDSGPDFDGPVAAYGPAPIPDSGTGGG